MCCTAGVHTQLHSWIIQVFIICLSRINPRPSAEASQTLNDSISPFSGFPLVLFSRWILSAGCEMGLKTGVCQTMERPQGGSITGAQTAFTEKKVWRWETIGVQGTRRKPLRKYPRLKKNPRNLWNQTQTRRKNVSEVQRVQQEHL